MKTGIVGLGLRAANVLKMLLEDLPELDLVGYVDPDSCGLSILDDVSHNLIRFETLPVCNSTQSAFNSFAIFSLI